MKMVKIYATDIKPEIRNDAFFGKGFEDAMKKAEENNQEVVVGEFFDEWRID